jgi:hypothetical protein
MELDEFLRTEIEATRKKSLGPIERKPVLIGNNVITSSKSGQMDDVPKSCQNTASVGYESHQATTQVCVFGYGC